MGFGFAMLGVLPVVLYGTLYLCKVVFAPEEMRWPDFYGFNAGGRWKISFFAMLIAAVLISFIFMLLQNA